jgi:hypothetical protein
MTRLPDFLFPAAEKFFWLAKIPPESADPLCRRNTFRDGDFSSWQILLQNSFEGPRAQD